MHCLHTSVILMESSDDIVNNNHFDFKTDDEIGDITVIYSHGYYVMKCHTCFGN